MGERIIYRCVAQVDGMNDAILSGTSTIRSNIGANPLHNGKVWLELEQDGRLIVSRGTGLWTIEQMTAHFLVYREQLVRSRIAFGRARVLVDMQDVGVQRAEVAAYISRDTRGMYREGDRVAMIVPSSLAKMQMRRVLDSRFHQYFVSENAARNWLAGGTEQGIAAA
jgi:hypothetical protein